MTPQDGDQTAYTNPTPLGNLALTAKASAKSTWDNAVSLARAAGNEAPSIRNVFLAPHKALLNSVSHYPVETPEEREQLAREEEERGEKYTEMKLAERRRMKRLNPDAYSPERESFPGLEKSDEALERVLERERRRRGAPSIVKADAEYKVVLEVDAEKTEPPPVLAWDSRNAESILEVDLEDVARGLVLRNKESQYDPLGVSGVWERPVKRESDAARRKEDLLREWREKAKGKGKRRDGDRFEEAELVPTVHVEKGQRGMQAASGM